MVYQWAYLSMGLEILSMGYYVPLNILSMGLEILSMRLEKIRCSEVFQKIKVIFGISD